MQDYIARSRSNPVFQDPDAFQNWFCPEALQLNTQIKKNIWEGIMESPFLVKQDPANTCPSSESNGAGGGGLDGRSRGFG